MHVFGFSFFFFFFFFAFYRKFIYILKEHLTCIKGEIINRKFYSNLVYVHLNFIAIIEPVTKYTLKDAFLYCNLTLLVNEIKNLQMISYAEKI